MDKKYKMFTDGKCVFSESEETFNALNLATEEVIAEVPQGTKEDAKKAVDAARNAFDKGPWSKKSPAERSQLIIWKLLEMVEQSAHRLARIESMNVDKTIRYSRESDLPFIVDNLRFFAGCARTLGGKSAACDSQSSLFND